MSLALHLYARTALPQLVTGSRVALGAVAVISAGDGALFLSATLITLSTLMDGIDGRVARWLDTVTPFGALFDYFCDYLTLVVAPWILTRALLAGETTMLQEVAIGLPLITGAIRYARNGVTVTTGGPDAPDLPGVGTVFCAFVSVTAVFLDAPARVSSDTLQTLIPAAVGILALLMVAPVPYPKLTRFAGWSPTVLVLLGVMPFAATEVLAAATVGLGMLYIIVGPFLARGHKPHPRS